MNRVAILLTVIGVGCPYQQVKATKGTTFQRKFRPSNISYERCPDAPLGQSTRNAPTGTASDRRAGQCLGSLPRHWAFPASCSTARCVASAVAANSTAETHRMSYANFSSRGGNWTFPYSVPGLLQQGPASSGLSYERPHTIDTFLGNGQTILSNGGLMC